MQFEIRGPGQLTDLQRSIARAVVLAFVAALVLSNPVQAQTLKQTGVSIFNALYAVVGVAGAIATLVAGLNWALGNFLGVHDPKKLFFQVLAGTAVAFGAVAIVQFIKEAVGDSSGGIGSL